MSVCVLMAKHLKYHHFICGLNNSIPNLSVGWSACTPANRVEPLLINGNKQLGAL